MAGCSQPPTIDGSIELPAAGWQRGSLGTWRQTLPAAPLQLFSGADPWLPAHHPNRAASGPSFLTIASDGNVTMSNGLEVSTRLTVGADLALPAAATLGPGTRVRVRTAAFVIDDLPVAGVDGRTLNLAAPSTYPLKAGWGYLLTGQAWMVDSPGEWFHDAASGQLTVQAHGDAGTVRLPANATVLTTGIDLQDRQHVVVDGLDIVKVGTGALLRGARQVQLRNTRIADVADRGIDAAASHAVVLQSNRIQRTGLDAVFAGGMAAEPAIGLVVRHHLIVQSGVLLEGETVQSLPRRSYAAILAGQQATVAGNVVIDSGYIGIRVFERSTVQDNVVIGACTVLDDCGGIYTLGAGNGSLISGNLVLRSRGNTAGKPRAAQAPQAQGIYIDDDASGVRVEGNTVIDADHGLHVHDAANNSLQGNRLYGNRVAQLWLQETRPGTLRANTVAGNQFAPVHALSRSLLAETAQASATAFGSFDGNRYFEPAPGRIGTVGTAALTRDLGALAWFGTAGLVSAAAPDAAGSHSGGQGHAAYTVAAGNLVPNGDMAASLAGWSHWNAAAPAGTLQRSTCNAGPCLRYTAGGPTGLVSSPNFSVEQGRWYRLTLDLATDGDGQTVQLVLRRGGGGANGYESLADRNLAFTAGTRLQRHSVVFQATRSVRAADPVTGDLGARVDIEGLPAGRVITLAQLEIVPITPYAAPRVSVVLVNAGDSPLDLPCPLPASQAALCRSLADLGRPGGPSEATRVSWPLPLPPRSSRILHGFEPALPDNDGDGIADWQDRCPGTPARQVVNATGC
jgi:parallel beta-helix repeat protein